MLHYWSQGAKHLDWLYLLCLCIAWKCACVKCMCIQESSFSLVVNESFAMTGAAYVMCLCLRLKCKLPIVSQLVHRQHFIVKHITADSSLSYICMFTKWVQVLNWTDKLQQLHLWITVWMYLTPNVCLFLSVSSGSVSVGAHNYNKL